MKKPVKLLILLLILGVLALAYLGLTRSSSSESDADTDTTESGSMTVFAADTDAITALQWTLDGETYTLEKDEEDESWSCAENYPLDADEVEDLVETVSSVLAERTVDISDSELSDFELDDPAMTVTISTSSVSTTLLLGMRNPYTDQNYAMIDGSDTVYLLDTDVYSAFEVTLLDLVETESLEDYSTSRTLTIETEAGTLVLLHPEENEGLGYSDDFTWFVQDEDGNYTALDATNTASLAAYITNMSWADVIAYEPADLSAYGLDSPLATVTIDYETDDEGEAVAVLLIGAVSEYEEVEEAEETETDADFDSTEADSSLNELLGDLDLPEDDGDAAEEEDSAAAASDTAEEAEEEGEALYYYAMLEGGEMVYTLKASTVEKILSASVDSLLPEDICLIDWDTLTAMTFTIDGEDYQFLIRRVESEDEDGNITESIVCTFNGAEVDENDVEDILDMITDLEAEATISTADDADDSAESDDTAAGDTDADDTAEGADAADSSTITIRFSRDRDTWSVMTMTLTEYDLSFYQVSFNGRSDQLVSIRDVAELVDAVVNFGVEEDLSTLTTG